MAAPARRSIRVLGPDNRFPAGSVWEAEIERAIRYCAVQGAKVVNLSIGDDETIYDGARSTPVAALIDQLARELKIVIVVPTGNVAPAVYLDPGNEDVHAHVDALLGSTDTQMIDPAPATSAPTVGALAPEALAGAARSSSPATRRVLGHGGCPAPFSRRGPGIDAAVKPEVSATGGSIAIDVEFGQFIDDDALGVLSTSGGIVERLLDVDIGTSFAVPRRVYPISFSPFCQDTLGSAPRSFVHPAGDTWRSTSSRKVSLTYVQLTPLAVMSVNWAAVVVSGRHFLTPGKVSRCSLRPLWTPRASARRPRDRSAAPGRRPAKVELAFPSRRLGELIGLL